MPPKLGGWGSEQAFIKPFNCYDVKRACACSDPLPPNLGGSYKLFGFMEGVELADVE